MRAGQWLALSVLVYMSAGCAAKAASPTATPPPTGTRPQFIEFFAGA
jgi:hypothetical protein